MLGLSKRHVDAKLDEIIDFAEIGDFIDTPVRHYSSGMAVRLGFSVAAVLLEPDVLLLDEVLAVGDIGFVIKCLNHMRRLTSKSAVVFVSHSMQNISTFCTRVLVMKRGQVLLDTPTPAEGIDLYYSLVKQETQVTGTGGAQVLGLDLLVNGEMMLGEEIRFERGALATALLRVKVDGPRDRAHVTLHIHDETTAPVVCTPIQDDHSRPLGLPPGEHLLEIPLGVIELNAGKYSFVVGVSDPKSQLGLARVQGLRPFRVTAKSTVWGKIVRPAVAQIKQLPD